MSSEESKSQRSNQIVLHANRMSRASPVRAAAHQPADRADSLRKNARPLGRRAVDERSPRMVLGAGVSSSRCLSSKENGKSVCPSLEERQWSVKRKMTPEAYDTRSDVVTCRLSNTSASRVPRALCHMLVAGGRASLRSLVLSSQRCAHGGASGAREALEYCASTVRCA